MAKCSSCGGTGSCQCVISGGQDGGTNATPSTVAAGGGSASNPYRVELAQALDTSYVPTLAGVTLGASTIGTRAERVGKEVTFAFTLILGAGFALPGTLVVPLPPTLPLRAAASANRVIGVGHIFDTSASANYAAALSGNGNATAVQLNFMGANGLLGLLTSGTPFVFAAGDTLGFTFKYTTA